MRNLNLTDTNTTAETGALGSPVLLFSSLLFSFGSKTRCNRLGFFFHRHAVLFCNVSMQCTAVIRSGKKFKRGFIFYLFLCACVVCVRVRMESRKK